MKNIKNHEVYFQKYVKEITYKIMARTEKSLVFDDCTCLLRPDSSLQHKRLQALVSLCGATAGGVQLPVLRKLLRGLGHAHIAQGEFITGLIVAVEVAAQTAETSGVPRVDVDDHGGGAVPVHLDTGRDTDCYLEKTCVGMKIMTKNNKLRLYIYLFPSQAY